MLINAVAPFAGAWIEITQNKTLLVQDIVAPFAGAWIEIAIDILADPGTLGRSLRGSVD